jgi:two-component system, cell cycle response regulator
MSSNDAVLTVLVADDSSVFRKFIEQSLTGKNYKIVFAETGREAIDLFLQHDPHIAIVDWTMPDMTGGEICRHIRAANKSSYTYVVIVTASTEKERRLEGLAAGADDYLTKPFDRGELVARLGVGSRIAQLHQELAEKNRLLGELALTDSLTGLPNRRAVEEWAGHQLSAAARHRFSFWVVFADLDNFKKVNDSFGHHAGDTVLKEFAELLRQSSRRSDICARIGGEEFLFVLTYNTETSARAVIERIRADFSEMKFQFGGETVSVTASFGVAEFRRDAAQDFESLVRRADKALFEAKRLGRNRVEFSS